MVGYVLKVTDFISTSPSCENCDSDTDSLFTRIVKSASRHCSTIEKLNCVKKHFGNKESSNVVNYKRLGISKILDEDNAKIVAYPESDIDEIYAIMLCLGMKSIPIVKNPWNKKLMGYLNFHKLEKALKVN